MPGRKARMPRVNPIRWNGKTIPRGKGRALRLTVAESYFGTEIHIPVYVRRGREDGPAVFVSGAMHGDEINGTGAIHAIIADPPFELAAGTLIMVPVINVQGFERHERYLPDRRDLNRCFPGSQRGSFASRMARAFMEGIVARCDYGIDLHSAAVRRTNMPHVRADMSDPQLAAFARAFGTELIVDSTGPAGSLRRAAMDQGCRTLIMEAGEVWKVEHTVAEYGIQGIANCLRHLGMVTGEMIVPPFSIVSDRTQWIRAKSGGFLRFHAGPGDQVERGEVLATNIDFAGRRRSKVTAPSSGIIIGMTTSPAVAPGDPVFHIARARSRALDSASQAVDTLPEDHLHERVRDDLSRNILRDDLETGTEDADD